jgi:hypothetical protein
MNVKCPKVKFAALALVAAPAGHLKNRHGTRVPDDLQENQATRHPRMFLAGVQGFEKPWIPAGNMRE